MLVTMEHCFLCFFLTEQEQEQKQKQKRLLIVIKYALYMPWKKEKIKVSLGPVEQIGKVAKMVVGSKERIGMADVPQVDDVDLYM